MQDNVQTKFLNKEIKHLRVNKERDNSIELANQKKDLKNEFARKRKLVLEKIKKLKSQGKGVEEIYKYTNDIIFEEDDEGDGAVTGRSIESRPQTNRLGSFTPQGIRLTRSNFNTIAAEPSKLP